MAVNKQTKIFPTSAVSPNMVQEADNRMLGFSPARGLAWMGFLLLVSALVGGCSPLESVQGSNTGGISATVVLPARWEASQAIQRRLAQRTNGYTAPVTGITSIRASVTADDISVPIKATFPASITQGAVNGIPPGENRTLTVEALKSNGEAVAIGTFSGVAVIADKVTPLGEVFLACPAAGSATADSLFASAKAALELMMDPNNTTPRDNFGQMMTDFINKFESAVTACFSKDEATFFASLFQILLFLDGQTTTDLLASLGMSSFQVEVDRVDVNGVPNGFNPLVTPIIGGTGTNVDLSAADLLAYLTNSFPASIKDSNAMLGGLPPTFTTNLSFDGGITNTEIDYTDIQIFRAFFGLAELPSLSLGLWNYPGVDEFLTTQSLDTQTNEYIINSTEAELYLKRGMDGSAGTGDEPLSANPTGMARWSSAWSTIFGALQNGINSLLAEVANQTKEELFTVSPSYLDFYDQEKIDRFNASLVAKMFGEIKNSFQSTSSSGVDLSVYKMVFFPGASGCDPLVKGGSGTYGTFLTPAIYKNTNRVSLGNVSQVFGAFWDHSDRETLVLTSNSDIQSLLFSTATLESEIKSVVPEATVKITVNTDDFQTFPPTFTSTPAGTTLNLFPQYDPINNIDTWNDFGVEVQFSWTDVTSQFSGVPAIFCADTFYSFWQSTDVPGALEY